MLGVVSYYLANESFSAEPRALSEKPLSFELKSRGKTISERDLHGKVTVLFFGFTFCPDICPTGLSKVKQVLEAQEGRPVQGLFVSVDPERDTPTRLAEYTAYFHPNIIGATADHAQLQKLTRHFGAFYMREGQDPESYQVAHSASFYLLDREGSIVRVFAHDTESEGISDFIDGLL